ncbi:hypothetical protein QJS04_geneDACA019930 [Acorus gramineus]|uniref:Uncharacterized protein n=1 Tax=Acorus gramineus TaxID=55184 RepID=A0AAV9AHF8_ACOGR|nr:hypothetical protein QJS04_geneDACA019930 [Acorus gramineus]
METHLLRFSSTIPRTGLHRPIRSPPRQSKTISSSASASSGGGGTSSFDAAAYEAERLRLDTAARDSMAMVAGRDIVGGGGEGEVDGDGKAWKWRIRKRIWDLMEAEGIARNPRPVHHRIPNFDGAGSAAVALGVAKFGRPIGLGEKIKVDLIVIGSVAVDPRTGARLAFA